MNPYFFCPRFSGSHRTGSPGLHPSSVRYDPAPLALHVFILLNSAVCIASHLLDVGWAGFRIKSTVALRQDYYTFVVDGACGTKDLLGNWWDQRLAHAVSSDSCALTPLIIIRPTGTVVCNQRDHPHLAWSSFSHLVPSKCNRLPMGSTRPNAMYCSSMQVLPSAVLAFLRRSPGCTRYGCLYPRQHTVV